MPSLVSNREAKHNYQILETFEAGIQLVGSEVKSLKSGNGSLRGAYATLKDNQLWLVNMHIGAYKPAGHDQHQADRNRRLLLNRAEIVRMIGRLKSQGVSLVPLSIYTKRGLIKVELGLGKGKKSRDKRASIKKREVDRRIGRALRIKG